VVANNGFSFPSIEGREKEREREEVERVVRTFSEENREVHGPNIIDFNKGRACGARRRLLKDRTVRNRFRISWIAMEGG